MANRPHQKQRLLVLLRLLYEKTDAEQGLTTQQIIEDLAGEGLEAERKAIYRDIRALNDAGFAVSNHGSTGWHLDTRPFELEELTMLADAAQSSPFLTDGMTDSLIEKLKALASENQRSALERRIEVPSRVKMQNVHALENVDTVQRAMRLRQKVEFRYFHYDSDKRRALNREGKTYCVTPVRLVYADEFYYLIAYLDEWAHVEGHQPFAPFRLDRMEGLVVSEAAATRDAEIATFRTDEHISPSFGVFAAPKETVMLELDERAMNPLIDKFGLDALVFKREGGKTFASVKAPLSPQFFGWLLQLGPYVKIAGPRHVREQFLQQLESARSRYEEG